MTPVGLIVSEKLEFRSIARSVICDQLREFEVRFAADSRIGASKIHEEGFQIIVVDDDTAKGLFDETIETPVAAGTAQFFRIRSGGRSSVRVRNTPFSYTEVIVPDTSDASGLKSALLQIISEFAKTSSRTDKEQETSARMRSQPIDSGSQALQAGHRMPDAGSAERQQTARSYTASTTGAGTSIATRTNPEIIIPDIVVIGSSTGGPEALERFFKAMDSWFAVPVVIVQHMPPGFTRGLAERITRVTEFQVHEAEHDQVIMPGHIYIAPGDYHLRLRKGGDKVICALDKGPLINSVRPAVDPMFDTAVTIYGSKVMALVFTGMGEDGAAGAVTVKGAGGCVAIQDEASCVVWGMPGSVARHNLHDLQGPPEKLAAVVSRQMMRRGAPPKKIGKAG